MGKHKKWVIGTLSVIMSILLLVVGFVVVIDPFFHYHRPIEGLSYSLDTDEAYLNPGIARHFDYDALITGSSMVYNFRTSYLEQVLGESAVKVNYSGATTKNVYIILDLALRNNPNLKTIYYGLDLFMLDIPDTNELRSELPEYLYNTNIFDDVSYVLNKDVLEVAIQSVNRTISGLPPTTFDDYVDANEQMLDSQDSLAAQAFDILGSREYIDLSYSSAEEAVALAHKHLQENIIPLIEAYPDVEFIIFFPPYSILWWYQNHVHTELSILRCAVETLIGYDNVSLFMFLNNAEIVTNLYNYTDTIHYKSDISSAMCCQRSLK